MRPTVIIGFCGKAGAGKSTAAEMLTREWGFTRTRFADPLKKMARAIGLSHEQVEGSEKEVPTDILCGKTPRQVMQWLGTEFGRDMIGRDLWINAWERSLDQVPLARFDELYCKLVTVDDVRFHNEANIIRRLGGILVRMEREGSGTSSAHASEDLADKLGHHVTIVNDKDHNGLSAVLAHVVRGHVSKVFARAA